MDRKEKLADSLVKSAQPISISKANRATHDAIVQYRLDELKEGRECSYSNAIFQFAARGLELHFIQKRAVES